MGITSTRIQKSVKPFKVVSPFSPSGDQPAAIETLAKHVREGDRHVVLRGATGTGKSATTAWLVENLNRPTLVLAHNKTLAAQLATELRELLPENAVEYFVSHFAFYQPEAYVPQTDTFIEKDSAIDDEVERLRHSATMSLLTRRDVVVVASVSAIYGLGSPGEYVRRAEHIQVGEELERDAFIRRLVQMGYSRNDVSPDRGTFRVRGDTLEVFPVYEERAVRIELFGDEVERLSTLHIVTGEVISSLNEVYLLPATHHLADQDATQRALASIEAELEERLAEFERQGKLLEAQRLKTRTQADLESIRETGSCKGIENYSRHFDGRMAGSAPFTLLDYFPEDFLLVIDESHVTVSQLGAMYEGDASRKRTLVEHGFRLPSALDNRPLKFEEFLARSGQTVYLSATPAKYELEHAEHDPVEQVIRPTGLLDPVVDVRPSLGQVDDLMEEIRKVVERDERALVTTLTKKMAEQLSEYLVENGVKAKYLHSDISTVDRIELLRELRLGNFDVLVGINLLREGLDLPEVSLVAILDADKEGFLRSTTSLIQTIGRAARNVNGHVVMYADRTTPSMEAALQETKRRRELQDEHNKAAGVDPIPLKKKIADIVATARGQKVTASVSPLQDVGKISGVSPKAEIEAMLAALTEQMSLAASELRFEEAASIRDQVRSLSSELRALQEVGIA